MRSDWQLQNPVDAIIFDCDGTLSTIEGIDVLAEQSPASKQVQALTAEAMGKTGMNPVIYQQRLELVRPTYSAVMGLGNDYIKNAVLDVSGVIRLLKRLQKSIYVVSAGLLPSITFFGNTLSIPSENIFAVDIQFDAQGSYLDFDRDSPLCYREGKRDIVNHIKLSHPSLAYVGDGLNDLVTLDLVHRFIGYGGTYYRENIAECCDFYLTTSSMAALLPLVLTLDEAEQLNAEEKTLYQKGLADLKESE